MSIFSRAIIVVFSCMYLGVAQAESPVSVTVGNDLYSDYMFRGYSLYDGWVTQPYADLSLELGEIGTLTASVWASIALENSRNFDRYNEVDYILTYSKAFGDFEFGGGHVWYTFPNESIDSTAEFFAYVSYDTFLSPKFTVYHDYDLLDTQYYELDLSHEIAYDFDSVSFALVPYVNFGWGSNTDKIYSRDGLEQVTTGLIFAYEIAGVSVSPSAHYTFKVDDNTINKFWGGVNVSYGF